MALQSSFVARVLGLMIMFLLTGCGTVKPEANSWSLPEKTSANSGMIIGRIDFPDNKTENPEHVVLNLEVVEFSNVAQVIQFGDDGEEHYIMANNYFVVPNLKPGTYRLNSFRTGNVYHGLQHEDSYSFEVKPEQIKFIGSLDYIQYKQTLLQKVGQTKIHPYNLRKAQKPTELEMLQWLNRISKGSGWESAIRKRIHEIDRVAKP